MRELVFELDYHPGWNPRVNTLVKYPDVAVRSLSYHVTAENLWRVDHISGSAEALTQYIWRIILPGNETIGSFADALRAEIDDVGGMELSDDTMLLDVGDAKAFVRERRDKRRSVGEFVTGVEERPPADVERHDCLSYIVG